MEAYCKACEEKFEWNDIVVVVEDTPYHKDCLSLYPSGYVAFLDDEFLGETENEDGELAFEIIDDLLDEEEEEN